MNYAVPVASKTLVGRRFCFSFKRMEFVCTRVWNARLYASLESLRNPVCQKKKAFYSTGSEFIPGDVLMDDPDLKGILFGEGHKGLHHHLRAGELKGFRCGDRALNSAGAVRSMPRTHTRWRGAD